MMHGQKDIKNNKACSLLSPKHWLNNIKIDCDVTCCNALLEKGQIIENGDRKCVKYFCNFTMSE